MDMNLYIIVSNRNSEVQPFDIEWGVQGKLINIQTTPAVVEAAEKAKAAGSKIYVYEINCRKPLKSHISQEVKIAEIDPSKNMVTFGEHNLIFRKAPFVANQKLQSKWHALEPTERMP
jgi:hypothetical protein